MRFLLQFILLFFSISLIAQFNGSNLLPVKIDQKWGLIDENGTLVMEPKYDLFGDRFGSPRMIGSSFTSAFITVQLDEKLGLINLRGQEVLPPIFDEIVDSFTDSIFTVIKNHKLLVVNHLGETIFDGKYQMVIPIPRNRDFYIVQENGKFGLVKKGKGYVIPNQYTNLAVNKINQPFLNFWTAASLEEGKYGLVNFENKEILAPEFDSIRVISPQHFLTKNKFIELRNEKKEIIVSEKEEWTNGKILSKSFLAFSSSYQKKGKIFSLKTNQFIETKTEYDDFRKFGNDFLLTRKRGKFGLIDTLGNEIIPPEFSEIQPLEGDLFRVKKFLWGIYQANQGLITPCMYDKINPFDEAFASVETRGKFGLINRKGEEVAPVQFEHFQFQAEFVKAFAGQSMNFYEADSLDRLTLIEVYPEVYTLRVGYADNEALPNINPFRRNFNPNRRRKTSGRGIKKKPDFSQIKNSDVEWFMDWGLWGLRRKSSGEILIKPKYENTIQLPFTDMTIVYSFSDVNPANALLELMTINPKKGSFGIAFYSHQQEKFISDFEFMGVRVEDFEYDLPYASCLDKNGKFVLVNQKGQVFSKNKTYDYIGEFYEGKARICIGGVPEGFKKPEEVGYKITATTNLQRQFKVRYNRFITAPTSDMWWIGGTWGFIDTMGREVIAPTFEFVKDFEEGTAICKKENWGAINTKNQTILDFEFKSINRKRGFLKAGVKNKRPVFFNALGNAVVDWGYDSFKEFSEGFCAVSKNGKWGMVNEKGEEVLACKYITINSFSEGWASIQDEQGWYFVDTTLEASLDFRGKEIFGLGSFNEGLSWFKIKRNDKYLYGFLDKEGEHIIPSIYTKAFDFQQGRARVVRNRKTGLIDKNGKFVMSPKRYDLVFSFDEFGMAQVRESNMGNYGLINRNGKTLTPCIYNKIFPFSNGYAKIVTKDGIGFVDTLGNEIIPPQYRAAGELSEGLVSVQDGFSYLWQYINMNNNIAFKGKYAVAEPFQNGKAIVTVRKRNESTNLVIDKNGTEVPLHKNGMVLHFSEDKYGFQKFDMTPGGQSSKAYTYYADSLGNPVFKRRRFLDIEPFEKNIALVKHLNRKWGTINQRGFDVIPKKFNRIFNLPNQMYSAIASELFGLYDADGKPILEPIYDAVESVKQDLFRVEQGSKIGYFTSDGIWLWQLQD